MEEKHADGLVLKKNGNGYPSLEKKSSACGMADRDVTPAWKGRMSGAWVRCSSRGKGPEAHSGQKENAVAVRTYKECSSLVRLSQ